MIRVSRSSRRRSRRVGEVAEAQAARRLLCSRGCRLPGRRRESDELGQEPIGLLGEGRPRQAGLVDPQRQQADDGRPEVERGSYDDAMAAQIETARSTGDGDLAKLLAGNDTWEVN